MRYPYRFTVRKLGKVGQMSYQLCLAQSRKIKEKLGSLSENTFMGRDDIVVYRGKRLTFWMKRGIRLGKAVIGKRVALMIVKSAVLSKREYAKKNLP